MGKFHLCKTNNLNKGVNKGEWEGEEAVTNHEYLPNIFVFIELSLDDNVNAYDEENRMAVDEKKYNDIQTH